MYEFPEPPLDPPESYWMRQECDNWDGGEYEVDCCLCEHHGECEAEKLIEYEAQLTEEWNRRQDLIEERTNSMNQERF